MTTLLETRQVSKIYRAGNTQVAALSGVSIEVRAGEFVAIQGTSGSGKSTLLNVLGGLDRPTTGEVLFEGRPLVLSDKSQMARYRRHSIGMIFQNFNLIPSMTAVENVSLSLAFGGVRESTRKRRACELLRRVGLDQRMDHRPSELSGGEQQRVAIARALANNPRVLLADEPTGNLDSAREDEILRLLREMVARDGVSVLMVTHNHELAERFADCSISLKDGCVVHTDSAQRAVERPSISKSCNDLGGSFFEPTGSDWRFSS